MSRFSTHVVSELEYGGASLAEARGARRLTIAQVSRTLKLPRQHIETMEESRWYDLPAGSYGRYFIRSYAQFLGLDPAPFLAHYGEVTQTTPEPHHLRPVVSTQKLDRPLTHPLRRLLLGSALTGLLLYLAFGAWHTFLPPELTLVSPAADLVSSSSALTVRGLTKPGAKVTINGELVQVSEAGYFSAPLSLTPGLNSITVVAQKAYSRPSTVARQVFFTPAPVGLGASAIIP
jgi:cytoskeleton protein RodZ